MNDGTQSGDYSGLDRYYRFAKMQWQTNSGSTNFEQRFGKYDRMGSLLRTDSSPASGSGDTNFDQAYTYDGLERLTSYNRGNLNGFKTIASPNLTQTWTLDALGNWAGFSQTNNSTTINGTALTTFTQTRSANAANEITGTSGTSGTGGTFATANYDTAGNQSAGPKGDSPTSEIGYVYDGWNRLVGVDATNNGSLTDQNDVKYAYDGAGRRITKFTDSTTDGTNNAGSTEEYFQNEANQVLVLQLRIAGFSVISHCRPRQAPAGSGVGMEARQVRRWEGHFEQAMERFGGCFARRDLRRQAEGYVRGLLGPVERKNGWQLAEHLGREKPYGLQRLLGRASWDADAVRDELTRYAAGHLITDGDPGVLIVDETGFLKKGNKSVGVQRQYSGTAGRIENCQVGVFLALSTSRGRALIDRALYLPQTWCEDQARCDEAGVPDDVAFATKPQLAMTLLARAFDAGLRPSFVLADEVYGSDSKFRRFLEARGQAFVVAVTSQQRLWVGFEQHRVDAIAASLAEDEWFRMSVADGSKGPRLYDWAAVPFGFPTDHDLGRYLLVRQHLTTGERAYYFCTAPGGVTTRDLAVAAGGRWAIETCFEGAKQETGLDEYEVRSWDGWHRHVTLSLLAMMFLTAVRLTPQEPKPRRSKSRRR